MKISAFNVLSCPLDGINLIEANAGTGKTHAIARIYLKLLMERRLSVDKILVVTFTEAATKELRQRIREDIRLSLAWLECKDERDDLPSRLTPDLEGLLQAQQNSVEAAFWLRLALRNFDEAAIHTIHGFCRKILHENTLESSVYFETDLLLDQQPLIEEAVGDFWRIQAIRHSSLFYGFLAQNQLQEKLPQILLRHLGRRYHRIIPEGGLRDTENLEKRYLAAAHLVRSKWRQQREDVIEVLLAWQGLNRNRYRQNTVRNVIALLEDWTTVDDRGPYLFPGFDKLCSENLSKAVKKGFSPPSLDFFLHCQNLADASEDLIQVYQRNAIALKAEAIAFVGNEIDERKKRRMLMSFDDLLFGVWSALIGPEGGKLAASVEKRFPAALIDEFQDTDAVQYDIFYSIYRNGLLYLIGDPKQSIYRFRGADVHAYLKAVQSAEQVYSLTTNHRCDADYLKALNCLFTFREKPFFLDGIRYLPAKSPTGENVRVAGMKTRNQSTAPLQIQFLQSEAPPSCISKEIAAERATNQVAGEIFGLLAEPDSLLIDDRPLRANDIAVLVRRNIQARRVQKALRALGIPSVLQGSENLFSTQEAMELKRILLAVAEPDRQGRLESALATSVFRWRADALSAEYERGEEREKWISHFQEYGDRWRRFGFVRMIWEFFEKEDVRGRLLALTDGERKLTNYLHLTEVLHQKSLEPGIGQLALLSWYQNALSLGPAGSESWESHQLRLEADDDAVRIVTIHRSKGLEYPITFCPFLWDVIADRSDEVVYHENHDPVLDLGSELLGMHKEMAAEEDLAESLRLLYVSLSRARHRCYVVWGSINQSEGSGLAYLLQGSNPKEKSSECPDEMNVLSSLRELAAGSGGGIQVEVVEAGPPFSSRRTTFAGRARHGRDAPESVRRFKRIFPESWRLMSYTSLTSGRSMASDHDIFIVGDPPQSKEKGISAFPKGARTGVFFHNLLEALDFSLLSDLDMAVKNELRRYGFGSEWTPVVVEAIENAVKVALDSEQLKLEHLRHEQTLRELEFTFPVGRLTREGLSGVFADFPRYAAAVQNLSIESTRGFMRGFIDLIFEWKGRYFLLDWKSNFLGDDKEDYRNSELQMIILNEVYFLQYHIYAVALHRHLMRTLPHYSYERHFGGIYYVFLRGIQPGAGPEYGVFFDKPKADTINRFDSLLEDS